MNIKCENSYKKRKKKYKYNNIINIDSMSITNDNINGNFNENNNFIIDNNEQNLIEYLLDKSLPNSYKKIKINDDNFNIININEYSNLLKINYNMTQLKKIAKYYNLKTGGNKPELTKFLYNSLLIKSKSIYIQKIYRKCLTKNFLYLHGPCIKYSSVNDTDFGTLDEIKKMKFGKLISFKDDDNFIYGFDIQSLYNLYLRNNKKNNNIIENPYTTKNINKNVYNQMITYLKYCNIFRLTTNIDLNELSIFNEKQQLQMKLLTLFQIMDSYGHYTNINWILNLDKYDLVKFIRELYDIWNYRANLSYKVKNDICSPNGKPFDKINLNTLELYNYDYVFKTTINIIEKFITRGIDDENKILGCMYILTGLTLVNSDVAEALPHLYLSVI